MNDNQAILRAMLVDAICETVESASKKSKLGVPEGPMYAAFMAHGCSLNQFQSYVSAAVNSGRIRKSGNLLFAVTK